MQGVVRSDYIWIDGIRFPVANGGKILRHRMFADGNFQVQRDRNEPDYSDLNRFTRSYPMTDFSKGLGLYVDHSPRFQGKIWAGQLEHSTPGLVTMPAYTQQVTGNPVWGGETIYKTLMFQGTLYAATSIGLYTVDLTTATATGVAASPLNPCFDLCIHKGNLWTAWGAATTVRYWTGAAWTTPANTINADRLCDLDTRLFGALVYSAANEGIQVQQTGDEGATAWTATIFYSNGTTQAAVPSPMATGAQRFIAAPVDISDWKLYLSTNSGVWEIDYTVGSYRLLLELASGNAYNGRALTYWPSTGKLYTNQKNTVIGINLATREAEAVGPEFQGYQAGRVSGLPALAGTGFIDFNYSALGISASCSDGNYLYIGTTRASAVAGGHACVLKMTPAGHWTVDSGSMHGTGGASTGFTAVNSLTVADINGNINSTGTDAVVPRLLIGGTGDTIQPLAHVAKRGDVFADHGNPIGTGDMFMETPWLTLGLPNVNKTAYTLVVDALAVPANWTLDLYYKTDYDDATNATLIANYTSATTFPVVSNVSSNDGAAFRAIKLLVYMYRTAGSVDNTLSPTLISMVLNWRETPPVRYLYEFDLLIDPELDREGRYHALEAALDTALQGASTIALRPADDENETVVYVVPAGPSTGDSGQDAEAALVDATQGRGLLPRVRLRLAQVL